jgi:hypothetical protein
MDHFAWRAARARAGGAIDPLTCALRHVGAWEATVGTERFAALPSASVASQSASGQHLMQAARALVTSGGDEAVAGARLVVRACVQWLNASLLLPGVQAQWAAATSSAVTTSAAAGAWQRLVRRTAIVLSDTLAVCVTLTRGSVDRALLQPLLDAWSRAATDAADAAESAVSRLLATPGVWKHEAGSPAAASAGQTVEAVAPAGWCCCVGSTSTASGNQRGGGASPYLTAVETHVLATAGVTSLRAVPAVAPLAPRDPSPHHDHAGGRAAARPLVDAADGVELAASPMSTPPRRSPRHLVAGSGAIGADEATAAGFGGGAQPLLPPSRVADAVRLLHASDAGLAGDHWRGGPAAGAGELAHWVQVLSSGVGAAPPSQGVPTPGLRTVLAAAVVPLLTAAPLQHPVLHSMWLAASVRSIARFIVRQVAGAGKGASTGKHTPSARRLRLVMHGGAAGGPWSGVASPARPAAAPPAVDTARPLPSPARGGGAHSGGPVGSEAATQPGTPRRPSVGGVTLGVAGSPRDVAAAPSPARSVGGAAAVGVGGGGHAFALQPAHACVFPPIAIAPPLAGHAAPSRHDAARGGKSRAASLHPALRRQVWVDLAYAMTWAAAGCPLNAPASPPMPLSPASPAGPASPATRSPTSAAPSPSAASPSAGPAGALPASLAECAVHAGGELGGAAACLPAAMWREWLAWERAWLGEPAVAADAGGVGGVVADDVVTEVAGGVVAVLEGVWGEGSVWEG